MEQSIRNTARGIVVDDGKLLVFRLAKADGWYSLPGGGIEFGENIEQAIAREMLEETGIKAEVGKLLCVQDMAFPDKHRIEFFYHIKNGSDYRNIDLSKATHGFEIAETLFVDPANTEKIILPSFLREIVPELVKTGPDNFEFRVLKGVPK
jgi:ADP-ribose pyrophosphatase YjhB (NUDIX family)